jgi:uncharacterized protein
MAKSRNFWFAVTVWLVVRKPFRVLLAALALYFAGCVIGGVLLAEMQLHPPRRPIRQTAVFAAEVRNDFHADLQNVSIGAADGAVLRGWYVKPSNDNGDAIILLHGVGDNREGVAGYARMFLDHGYRVLLPDSRAHGTSGGEIATYGLKESDDIHRWVDWLEGGQPKCVYGFGESMGAALLLQSLAKESRFCAVVVESSFSRFDEVAPERAARYTHMPFWFGRTLEGPVIWFAIAYMRWKYGLDFRKANPADAVAHSRVPVLLIAGTRDLDILPHHSEELAWIDPNAQLWMVKGAAHGGAWGANPELFESRVVGFFAEHHH